MQLQKNKILNTPAEPYLCNQRGEQWQKAEEFWRKKSAGKNQRGVQAAVRAIYAEEPRIEKRKKNRTTYIGHTYVVVCGHKYSSRGDIYSKLRTPSVRTPSMSTAICVLIIFFKKRCTTYIENKYTV